MGQRFTPALLQAMAEAGPGETCRFPGCREVRYTGRAPNPYHACAKHRGQIQRYQARWQQQYVQTLRDHGLSTKGVQDMTKDNHDAIIQPEQLKVAAVLVVIGGRAGYQWLASQLGIPDRQAIPYLDELARRGVIERSPGSGKLAKILITKVKDLPKDLWPRQLPTLKPIRKWRKGRPAKRAATVDTSNIFEVAKKVVEKRLTTGRLLGQELGVTRWVAYRFLKKLEQIGVVVAPRGSHPRQLLVHSLPELEALMTKVRLSPRPAAEPAAATSPDLASLPLPQKATALRGAADQLGQLGTLLRAVADDLELLEQVQKLVGKK